MADPTAEPKYTVTNADRRSRVIQGIAFPPGKTPITDKQVEILRKSKTFEDLIRSKRLAISDGREAEADQAGELDGLTITEAIAKVKACDDVEVLKGFAKGEPRGPVAKAISARVAELGGAKRAAGPVPRTEG